MFAIIGILIVIAAIMGGYLMEHGIVKVLLQPAELLIILGAAIGTVLIANPLHILKKIAAGIVGVFTGSKFTKERYVATLKMMYDLFNKARKEGLMGMEADVEEPAKSAVFAKHPQFLKDHHVRDFVCDTLRMAITGAEAFDLDQLLDLDMEVHHLDAGQPIAALSSMADSLPGLGIVAAVLGVVITMGALGGPPEEIGHKVAAALVGRTQAVGGGAGTVAEGLHVGEGFGVVPFQDGFFVGGDEHAGAADALGAVDEDGLVGGVFGEGEELADLFADQSWDKGKMVRSFARMGAGSDSSIQKVTSEKVRP